MSCVHSSLARGLLVVCAVAEGLHPSMAQGQAAKLVGEARFVEALADVAREADPLRRAQNELWVRHHAGDLEGALSAGVAGLKAHPRDPFLLEESAFIAISLRRATLAAELLPALETLSVSGALSVEEGARLAARAAELQIEVHALVVSAIARRDALRRARAVVAGVLAGMAIFGGFLARSTADRKPAA